MFNLKVPCMFYSIFCQVKDMSNGKSYKRLIQSSLKMSYRECDKHSVELVDLVTRLKKCVRLTPYSYRIGTIIFTFIILPTYDFSKKLVRKDGKVMSKFSICDDLKNFDNYCNSSCSYDSFTYEVCAFKLMYIVYKDYE